MPLNALSSAVSGLNAASLRIQTAGNNIANARSVGRPDATERSERAFQAQEVVQSSLETGGTTAEVVTRDPGGQLAFDPSSPLANDEGFVETPNVDFAQEFSTLIQAEASYKASLKVIETVEETERELIDVFT